MNGVSKDYELLTKKTENLCFKGLDIDKKNCSLYDRSGNDLHSLSIPLKNINNEYDDFNILKSFEYHAQKNFYKKAIVFGNESINFFDLNIMSNKLARKLIDIGVIQNELVCIVSHKSIDLVIGILGVMKAGGAYVPIDANFPSSRINNIIQDCESNLVLVNDFSKDVPLICSNILNISDQTISEESPLNLSLKTNTNNLIYCMFTSGTTGVPKGIPVRYRNINTLFRWYVEYFNINNKDNVLLTTPLHFDFSQRNLLCPLSVGATVYMSGYDSYFNPSEIVDIYQSYKITFLSITPSMFYSLINFLEDLEEIRFPFLKNITLGGEFLSYDKIYKFNDENIKTKITNLYGVTEDSGFATYFTIPKNIKSDFRVPIGKPITHKKIYIINQGKLCDIGNPGEICISGFGVVDGYLNNDKLTKEQFIYCEDIKEYIYHTGDIGVTQSDGNINYIGRMDQQVKIRGIRIEIEEIERALSRLSNIKGCKVLSENNHLNETILKAYISCKKRMSSKKLRKILRKVLPDYMIPTEYVYIDRIPLTTNGKIDIKELRKIACDKKSELILPQNNIDNILLDIYREVLKVDEIGIDHDFFRLGGNSLNAILIINKIESVIGYRLNVGEFLKNSSIRKNSQMLINKNKNNNKNYVKKAKKKERYRATSIQTQLYFLSHNNAIGTAYNIYRLLKINKEESTENIKLLIKKLVDKYDILRTRFEFKNEKVYQVVENHIEIDFTFVSSEFEEIERQENFFAKGFDLNATPLFRIVMFENAILFDFHHSIVDEEGMDILLKEFTSLYNNIKTHDKPWQFIDYSEWETKNKENRKSKYWEYKLNDIKSCTTIPSNYERPRLFSYKGKKITKELSPLLLEQISNLASNNNVTSPMIMVSVLMIVISRYNNQYDIQIGIPVSSRVNLKFENIIGPLINTIVLRGEPIEAKTYRSFLKEIKKEFLDSIENQFYLFDTMMDELQVDNSRFFNILFNYINVNEEFQKSAFCTTTQIKFDLEFLIKEYKNKSFIELNYCKDIYEEEFICDLLEQFIEILNEISFNCEKEIGTIGATTIYRQISHTNECSGPSVEYDTEINIVELLKEKFKKNENKLALVISKNQLTYKELDKLSDKFAHKLLKMGTVVGGKVALIMGRSIEMIVAIYGVLKAGCAYIPIDINLPEIRIKEILKDCSPDIIATESERLKINTEIPMVSLKNLKEWTYENNFTPPSFLSNELAYYMYTSGTSGKPKAVQITHKNLVNYIVTAKHNFMKQAVNKKLSKIISITNYTFDIFITDTLLAMYYNLTVFIANDKELYDYNLLANIVASNSIEIIQTTPSKFNLLLNSKRQFIDKLRLILLGGEPLHKKLVDRILQQKSLNCQLINLYGPTETTVWSMMYECKRISNFQKTIPIGKPLSNTEIYIMVGNSIRANGCIGEICIGGDGVSSGYLNNSKLTLEKFVANPFKKGKLYRTGDLGRRQTDGNVEFLGRIDNQIKINGVRIEPEEIENKIRSIENISDCVVVLDEDGIRN